MRVRRAFWVLGVLLGVLLLFTTPRGYCDWYDIWGYAANGYLEGVKSCVEQGVSVEARDSFGDTPLHWAAYWGRLEVVKWLVEHGANVNARNDEGNTPLHKAAKKGHLEVVKYLVEYRADVNAINDNGESVLDWAVASENWELVNYLKSKGAKHNIENWKKEDNWTRFIRLLLKVVKK